jgi:hypothetical protein
VEDDKYFDYIAREGKQIGFNLDSRWPGRKGAMAIKVTYLDAKAGTLQLIHNGGKSVKELPLTGDGKLKTNTFILSSLALKSMEHGFDFILRSGANTEDIVISMVRVVAM